MVTLFKGVSNTSTGFNRDVFFALDRIKNGSSKDIVNVIRSQPKEKHNEIKKSLPGVCFNGTFRHRSASGLQDHSGLMIIDIDGFENPVSALDGKQTLARDPYIFSCWISPSALGVKALVKIPRDAKRHKGYFESFRNYLNHPLWDNSGSDVSRFCFESYDPDIYINVDSDTWIEIEEPEIEDLGVSKAMIPVTSENRIISNLLEWWTKKYGATKGSRNVNLYKLAIALNDFGINKSEADNILSSYTSDGFNLNEIRNISKSAYSKKENFNTKQFEDKQTQEKIEKLVRVGKSKKDIAKEFEGIDEHAIEEYTSSVKECLDLDEFWFYDDKNRIRLSAHKYKFWLEQHNFFKYYPSENSPTFTFIKKDQNLLEETNDKRIKDYVLNYILSKPDIGFGPYDFMASNGSYFRSDFLSLLDTTDIELKEDTKDRCYLYYRNCVVEITSDSIREIDYIDVEGYVWKRRIIDREYKSYDHHQSVFRKFIWLISGRNVNRYNSFKSVIGYLLHSFKTSANNKAIIFNDEVVSETANGGSGKGIFWNALKYMKKVSSIDGKTFEFTKSFPYQTVSADTQILVFDDVKKNFDFESLFSIITEGITLEYKGQDAITIPVEKSPKILITTNYTVGGVGDSFERRKFEVEMSSHFSKTHTPLDEFGHMLFTDWSAEEWLMFDNYMINCEQYYLINGLVKHEFHNLDTRKFIKETSYEFYEWVTESPLPVNQRFNKTTYYETVIAEFPDFKKWLSQKRFSKWLEQYGDYMGFKTHHGRTNSQRWIEYESSNHPSPDEPPF